MRVPRGRAIHMVDRTSVRAYADADSVAGAPGRMSTGRPGAVIEESAAALGGGVAMPAEPNVLSQLAMLLKRRKVATHATHRRSQSVPGIRPVRLSGARRVRAARGGNPSLRPQPG